MRLKLGYQLIVDSYNYKKLCASLMVIIKKNSYSRYKNDKKIKVYYYIKMSIKPQRKTAREE